MTGQCFFKTTNYSFFFWDNCNLRVLTCRLPLQSLPTPSSWTVYHCAEVLGCCVVGALPQSRTAYLTPAFLPTHCLFFLHLLTAPVRFAGAHHAGCGSYFCRSPFLVGFTVVWFSPYLFIFRVAEFCKSNL